MAAAAIAAGSPGGTSSALRESVTRCGMPPTVVVTIGTADVEVARHLELAVNAPVAEVRRIFKDSAGTVIYLADVIYRGDAIRIEMDLKP